MVPWSSHGEILRWWRNDVLGLSQQQAADRLSVQPSALSNWEHDARAISIDIHELDRALGADGVLAGLLWSFGSVEGLDPALNWTHVFAGDSTPVWLWLRAPTTSIKIVAEWGVARLEPEVDLSPNGLFVFLAASVSESPVIVTLSEPGWVDFGRGTLPEAIPGAEVLSGVDLLRRSSASGAFMDLFISNLAGKLSGPRSRELVTLATLGPKAVASFLSGLSRSPEAKATGSWTPVPETVDELDRPRFARLRRARGLSLADTIDLLVKEADISISKETLRRFETDVGHPHVRHLPAALDEVLGGAGHLGLSRIRSDRGNGSISFPPFWHGPVWLELDGPSRERTVRLRWGDWYRQVRIVTPTLLAFTCTTPEAPIRITVDTDVSWSGGLGSRAGVTSIDHNWVPASVSKAQRALSDTEGALLRSLQPRRRRRGGRH